MKSAYLFFHLNLYFSSISVDHRKTVVKNSYWPLLRLCRVQSLPINIELPDLTYNLISEIDHDWIKEFNSLINDGLIEKVASGYSQNIAPLMPSSLISDNITLSRDYNQLSEVYFMPSEMAVDLRTLKVYNKVGITRLLLEYENIRDLFVEDPTHFPGSVNLGHNATFETIFYSSTLFQQFQRLIQRKIKIETYFSMLESAEVTLPYIPIYASDAEIFGFRPGRFKEEGDWNDAENDWPYIDEVVTKLKNRYKFCKISQLPNTGEEHTLQFSLENPVFVKKQEKYNIHRWGVTNFSDNLLNSLCYKIFNQHYHELSLGDRKTLLKIWSSDFRTHIKQDRLAKINTEANSLLKKFSNDENSIKINTKNLVSKSGKSTEKFKEGGCKVSIDNMFIEQLSVDGKCIVQSVKHADMWRSRNAADFYSGGLIIYDQADNLIHTDYEIEGKVIDGRKIQGQNGVKFGATVDIRKSLIVKKSEELSLSYQWNIVAKNSARRTIRAGNILVPANLVKCVSVDSEGDTLNVGENYFDNTITQSAKISCSTGMPTETGILRIHFHLGYVLELKTNLEECFSIYTAKRMNLAGNEFLRFSLSLSEIDDTSRPYCGTFDCKLKLTVKRM